MFARPGMGGSGEKISSFILKQQSCPLSNEFSYISFIMHRGLQLKPQSPLINPPESHLNSKIYEFQEFKSCPTEKTDNSACKSCVLKLFGFNHRSDGTIVESKSQVV
jgi:hypothetical protein